MALKVHDNGFIEIRTKKDAAQALQAFQALKVERDELYEESGLKDMEADLVAYKKAVENFMVEKEIDQLQCDGFHGTLVKGFHGGHWLTTPDDVEAEADKLVALERETQDLQTIIEEKFGASVKAKGSKARKLWMKITRRVVDKDALERVIANGDLTVKDVTPAWIEWEKAPYLRVFED